MQSILDLAHQSAISWRTKRSGEECAMSELIFACEGSGQLRRQPGYRKVSRKEYYEGDYQILPGDDVNVRIEKGLDSAYSIINLRSSTPLKFRRTTQHIHRDHADVSVFWFVKRGSITLSQSGGKQVIGRDQCLITRSMQPFQMDCLLDGTSDLEMLHVVVPTHIVRAHIPDHVRTGTSFPAQDGDCRLALRTFELLYIEGATVSHKAADGLAGEAVSAIGAVLNGPQFDRPRSLGDRRFEDIEAFVLHQLGNPELSADMTARGTGISYGYLLHILKARGTSFSRLVWSSRLALTRKWLAADNMRHVPISQIAFLAGYKSPAHFSRAFRQATGTTPGDFRQRSPGLSS
ncbi:MAG: AraC family transcriptional regulator [Alphaproteobacteria bacterium]|nr:MAG: AraC family transcriptional regulator [Alphaproteobacteria bacterium]